LHGTKGGWCGSTEERNADQAECESYYLTAEKETGRNDESRISENYMEGRQVLYLCYWRRFLNLWTGVWDSRCAVDWAAPIYCSLPPYPPPLPPRAPPPLLPPPAPCGDQLAGRQQLRDGRTAKHCWELPSSHVACERYYSNTSAGTALCVAPAESEAVCGQSDFILDCISPPPSPLSPPPSPAAPSPGRPISALEAAIGIDPETRPIFAASALAAFSVGFLLFLAFFVSPPAAAAPPPPDEEEEEADAAAAGGEGNGSSLLAGAVRSDEAAAACGSWTERAHDAWSKLAHDAQHAASAAFFSNLSDLARNVKEEKRLSLSGGQLPGPTAAAAAAAAAAAEYGESEAAGVAARIAARLGGSFEDAEQY